jgi:lysophospholipase L1-like esterase
MWILALVLLAVTCQQSYCQQPVLREGDRVVFYGDSITAQRLYTRFVEEFVLTRFPQMHVTFWNAGVSGDTVYGGYTGDMPTRLKRDTFLHQPTVITVMLGMNDGYYMKFNPKYLDVYQAGYRKLLGALHEGAPSARVTLISPTPYDEVTHGTEFANYNQVVSRHSAFVKSFAASVHLGFSDFNEIETRLLNAGTDKSTSLAALLIPDRIHPGEASQWAMAAALAHSWGLSPVVSSVRIDAPALKTSAVENARIENLTGVDGKLQWTQTDGSLPLPLQLDDVMIQLVLSISELAAMDQQSLSVSGLPAARYTLQIDGRKIASFSREQLAAGVNLALYTTPMEGQSKGVDAIEAKRTRLDEVRFLLTVEDPTVANAVEATKAIEAKDETLAAEQRKLAQPMPHHFELSPE